MFSLSKYQVPLAVTFVLSLVVLFTPASGVPSGFEHSDKIVHLVLFAALAYTSRVAGVSFTRTALWTAGFAVVSEVVQGLAPLGRSGSGLDVLADIVGIAIGCAIAHRFLPRGHHGPPQRERREAHLH